jgi:hypothetical protein
MYKVYIQKQGEWRFMVWAYTASQAADHARDYRKRGYETRVDGPRCDGCGE